MVRKALGPCGDVAVEDARRMLAHRAGTAGEDLYAYDLTAGRRLDSVVSSKRRHGVVPSDRMKKRVRAAVDAGHDVVTLHNHPGSSIPSVSDLRALRAAGCKFGAIAAHDGSLFTYELVGEPAPGYNLDRKTLARFYDARNEAKSFKAIEQLLGVKIVHLTPRGR
jgi:proteasome lid subunit RPN8/RPN11